MNWSKGYVVNQGYTYGYYHEISPLALTWASLIRGHITPLNKFNYLELGCGQGMSLIINAANHPDSNFVGIDFMPDHIQHARDLYTSKPRRI
jgi:tRNA G46 methylase TrmB